MKRLIVLLPLVLFLAACKPYYITDADLGTLKQGQSVKQVQQHMDREADKVYRVETRDATFDVHSFSLLVDQTQQMTMSCTQYGCVPIFYTVPVTEPYVLAFVEDRLFAWGFVHELKKDPSRKVSELGEAIHAAMQNK